MKPSFMILQDEKEAIGITQKSGDQKLHDGTV
jgi:hypothetical protein